MRIQSREGSTLVLALFLLFVADSSRAADWHVDPAAAEGGGGGDADPFRRIADAMAVAGPGDRVLLAPGVYSDTVALSVYGMPRRAVLVLGEGVEVVGAGRGLTVLRAPTSADALVFGITAEGVSRAARVRDLTVDGPCFQGVNLRDADPVIERIDVLNDVTGGSSVAMNARDGSDPLVVDVRLDGGHSALFVEFGSAGTFVDCRVGRRPNEGMSFSNATPTLERVVVEGAGRDVLVLNQASIPVLRDCSFLAPGGRWTVRVATGYAPASTVDLSGNRWYTDDVASLGEHVLDAVDDPRLGATVRFDPIGAPVAVQRTDWTDVKLRFGVTDRTSLPR